MIKNIKEEIENISKWIREYVSKTNSKGVVIGNSGGKDSATVIALACKALGKEKVMTITMPCNSIKKDIEDAKLVAKTFDVPILKIDLEKTYNTLEKEIQSKLKDENEEAKINTKPRLRMTTLYYVARTLNYLVMGTGNKCEITVGYTTKWGDNASDFNPIGDFTVEEVCQIGKYLGVPDSIINKPPSDGIDGRTDEQKLGVTYKEISEYINKGKTKKEAMEIIKEKEKLSRHKREKVPIYNKRK